MNVLIELGEDRRSSEGLFPYVIGQVLKRSYNDIALLSSVPVSDQEDLSQRIPFTEDINKIDEMAGVLVIYLHDELLTRYKQYIVDTIISSTTDVVIVMRDHYKLATEHQDIMCNIDRMYSRVYRCLDDGTEINPVSEAYVADFKDNREYVVGIGATTPINLLKSTIYTLSKGDGIKLDVNNRSIHVLVDGIICIAVESACGMICINTLERVLTPEFEETCRNQNITCKRVPSSFYADFGTSIVIDEELLSKIIFIYKKILKRCIELRRN